MMKSLTMLVLAGSVVAGCATVRESRVNPMNWFGRSAPVPASVEQGSAGPVNTLIPARRQSIVWGREEVYGGQPIETIDELLIERRPGGAIIRATGIADRAGPFDVRLVEDEAASTGGIKAYRMLALQSAGPRSTGPRARMVTVADWLTDQELFGVSQIRVSGRANALAASR
ncbi:hypothetical protein GCM10011415_25270 [Salipiger pallidus]|uniref:Lipoprotein n=1 Tax=Salipiger pallidus TaxID=1775170 RepID=A0A8J2ZKG7_9RHOB|nr:hypothetical protein [Salipiger pallidus]GGG75640.1 hypothetical protein GCM10011415_25270 [Salipiger pallidus]